MATTFVQFARQLDALPAPPELDWLVGELGDLAIDCAELGSHVTFSSLSYARNLVKAGAHHHLLVLCWKNGQRSPIHDHRGSVCGVRVLRGTMTETFFERAPNGHIKATSSRDIAAGGVVGGQDSDIHQVSNLQAASADLVTLHVYSPPLLVMGTYSLTDAQRGEERMFLEFCDAAGI
jgi:cysteine dioxygenase